MQKLFVASGISNPRYNLPAFKLYNSNGELSDEDTLLLNRFLVGETNPEEAKQAALLLDKSAAARHYLANIAQAKSPPPASPKAERAAAKDMRFKPSQIEKPSAPPKKRIAKSSQPTSSRHTSLAQKKFDRQTVFAVIAVLVVCVLAALIPTFLGSENDSPKKDQSEEAAPKAKPVVEVFAPRLEMARLVWREGRIDYLGEVPRILRKGEWLYDGETVASRSDAAVVFRYKDGSRLELAPGSTVTFSGATQAAALVQGSLAFDTGKITAVQPQRIQVIGPELALTVAKDARFYLLTTVPRQVPGSSASEVDVALHVWRGKVAMPGIKDVEVGQSLAMRFRFGESEAKISRCLFRVLLPWQNEDGAQRAKGKYWRPGMTESYEVAAHESPVLKPSERLLLEDLRDQVDVLAAGHRFDVDIVTLLHEGGLVDDGHWLKGEADGSFGALVSLRSADGREVVSSGLAEILDSVPDEQRIRLKRVLKSNMLAYQQVVVDGKTSDLNLSTAGIYRKTKLWVKVPANLGLEIVLVNNSAFAHPRLLLEVLAEFVSCRVEEARFGFELVPLPKD